MIKISPRRKSVIPIFLLFVTFQYGYAQKMVSPRVDDVLKPASTMQVHGFVGEKLDQSYENRILKQNVDQLVEPFRNRTETRLWQSEFWGKWFTSAVQAYKYRPQPNLEKVLNSAVTALIATQTADGYIGNYKEESHLAQWDIWGRKYTMLGLLDYYRLTQSQKSLLAAIKVADHLIKEIDEKDGIIVTKGNYRGMAASSVLEPIVQLYSITNDKKYLNFANRIVSQWETNDGPRLISKSKVDVGSRFPKPKNWYSWEQGQKAYEMMSCYEGLLELYRITGDPTYKEAVENTWQNIKDKEINIAGSGASLEMWFGGKAHQVGPIPHYQETCVTTTWIKLSQQLLKLTGNPKYADEIERAYYNALLGALSKDGADWAKYTPLNGQRLPGSGQCGMELNCCVASGPRGQFSLPHTIVMSTKEGAYVNFFVDGTYGLKTPSGKSLKIVQKTDYPKSGEINLSFASPISEVMDIKIRIPSWSNKNTLKVNGELVNDVKPGEYVSIKRKWTDKDIISLNLDMRGRVEKIGKGQNFAAIMRGPIVLARDASLPGPPLSTVNVPVADENGYVNLIPLENNAGFWMKYSASFIPESYTEKAPVPIDIILCDYASAGNVNDKSAFTVWMSQFYNTTSK